MMMWWIIGGIVVLLLLFVFLKGKKKSSTSQVPAVQASEILEKGRRVSARIMGYEEIDGALDERDGKVLFLLRIHVAIPVGREMIERSFDWYFEDANYLLRLEKGSLIDIVYLEDDMDQIIVHPAYIQWVNDERMLLTTYGRDVEYVDYGGSMFPKPTLADYDDRLATEYAWIDLTKATPTGRVKNDLYHEVVLEGTIVIDNQPVKTIQDKKLFIEEGHGEHVMKQKRHIIQYPPGRMDDFLLVHPMADHPFQYEY